MKKITIILMIVVFSLLIVGCPSTEQQPTQNPNTFVGGGCGLQKIENSELLVDLPMWINL